MVERVEVEYAANRLPKFTIEPAFEFDRTLSLGRVRRRKRTLRSACVEVVDDGAGALDNAPGVLQHWHKRAGRYALDDWNM
jgi:hypothetical protein